MAKTALLFIIVYAGALMAALVVDGAWAFYVYQLVYFLNPAERWWGAGIPEIPYSMITAVTLIITVGARWGQLQNQPLTSAKPLHWAWAILAWYAIVSFWAINDMRHQQALVDLAKLLLIVTLAIKALNSRHKLRIAMWCYVIGTAYIGWEAFNTGRTGFGRLEGIGMADAPDGNAFSAALVPAIPMVGYFLWRGNWRERVAAVIVGAFVANAIVLVNSRGSFLATAAAGGYLCMRMLFYKGMPASSRFVAIGFIFAGLIGVLSLTDSVFWERMATLLADDSAKSGASRTDMWVAAVRVAFDYPMGVGAWGFQALSNAYVVSDAVNIGSRGKAVHSIWFQNITELGWIGLFLFLGLLRSLFLSLRLVKAMAKSNRDVNLFFFAIAIEAGLIGFLVAATFIDQFRAQILYWLIAFVCALRVVELNTSRSSSTESASNPAPRKAAMT